jgi:predicted small secreted protein
MRWMAIVTAALLVAGCNSLQGVGPEVDALSERSAAADHSESGVYWFHDGSPVEGSRSTLVRNDAGVSMTLQTNQLVAGDAVTMWWVVFNDPSACSDGVCDEDDVLPPGVNPAAQVGVLYAAGNVIGASGRGNFGARLGMGDDEGLLFGHPLTAPRGAEVHLIVRSHGPAVPGMIPEQIHSFGGGCSEATGGPPGADGFDCYDPQFAVHKP